MEIETADGVTKVSGERSRLLLATLLLHRNASVSAGRLIDALWGDAAPSDPANARQA